MAVGISTLICICIHMFTIYVVGIHDSRFYFIIYIVIYCSMYVCTAMITHLCLGQYTCILVSKHLAINEVTML